MYSFIFLDPLMKIFTTFDTEFKQERLTLYQEKYGKTNVILIERSKLFFWLKIVFPLLALIAISLIALWWIYIKRGERYVAISCMPLIITVAVIGNFRIIRNLIDYHMDFCIITPDEIIFMEQKWIFERVSRILDVTQVKSIYINKKTVLYSIFNNGTMSFMSDGSGELGEVDLEYVYHPEEKKDIIYDIISDAMHRSA